ncbi:MAG: TerB family tellurite resistance protein [Flavobacteriaceae bacterium]|nr:molecular chaperone DjlA [Flavobacteriaceae bacterium]MDG2062952.1 TerB family tellurite resistance protein [Flavobacteriaceae bacterium]
MIKWILAILGYSYLRFPGAILGFFVGGVIERLYNPSSSWIKIRTQNLNPEIFQLNLLALAATIIKADGIVKKQELQFVRNFFISNYGPQKASTIFEKFNVEIKKDKQNISDLTEIFIKQAQYETRLQILHFLFGVANADGVVSQTELTKVEQISAALGIRQSDMQSIKAMFIKDIDNAYTILEIISSATDDEVKKAYRTMAKKYHPDKLRSKDPALIKGAKEKFQKVQEAYEVIQKERNL